ncbi:hypothetical protein EJ04DRAFT_517555 [Polyplosphaeria fusca]|uniref:Rhodopsin domain-containing protein n=1 Tax=Polyplosphaeria fusca TaxID=682080 RepID=A0A9P4QIL1_9PLEO|nr:hypothetical protein EJ04DRAFT_517555 [Polyplosphaeria fusca]
MPLYTQRDSLGVNIALPVLALLAVVLRFVVQRRTKNGLGVSFILIVVALVLSIAICALGIYGSVSGLTGVRLDHMSLPTVQRYFLVIFIDVLLCHLVYELIKVSILLFYKRIFPTPKFNAHANTVLGVVTAFTITITLVQIFGASPIDGQWKVTKNGRPRLKYDHPIFIVSVAAIDMVLNLWTLALPLPVIKNLHLDKQRKVGISMLFLLGGFCVVSSTVRLYYVALLVRASSLGPERLKYVSNANDLWAHIEACASIVTACLPTLAPLYRKLPFADRLGSMLGDWVLSIETFFQLSWQLISSKQRGMTTRATTRASARSSAEKLTAAERGEK